MSLVMKDPEIPNSEIRHPLDFNLKEKAQHAISRISF